MKGDISETFKMIPGTSTYGTHFFNISLRMRNVQLKQFTKTKSAYQLDSFANKLTYF